MGQLESETSRLQGTAALSIEGDVAAQMIAGIHRYCGPRARSRRSCEAAGGPGRHCRTLPPAILPQRTLSEKRREFARNIGVIDELRPVLGAGVRVLDRRSVSRRRYPDL